MLGERLKQVRTARGLSQRDIAQAVGVSATAISYYETGKDYPSSGVLLRLASALNVTLDYFFRTVSVHLGEPAYRKHSSLTDSRRIGIENMVRDRVERYLEAEALFLEGGTSVQPILDVASAPITDIEGAETRAKELRELWGLMHYPVGNLTELLEEHRIKVIYISGCDEFDGCAYPDGDVPVVVVNQDKPGDRIRFDLAHELGHLLLRFVGDWEEAAQERAAHRFAGALLAPAEAVVNELGSRRFRLSLRELHGLKHKYGMSMQAWIYRARDLDIISKTVSGQLFGTFRKNNWTLMEPGTQYGRESTDRCGRLVARAYVDRIISEGRAAELLGIPLADAAERLREMGAGQDRLSDVSQDRCGGAAVATM